MSALPFWSLPAESALPDHSRRRRRFGKGRRGKLNIYEGIIFVLFLFVNFLFAFFVFAKYNARNH